MRFRVLGPLSVEADDGSLLLLQRPSQRATLVALLLHGSLTAGRTQLIDAIWGDDPPDGADAALRVRISQLRGALTGHARIHTLQAGYRLVVRDGELDAQDFRALTTRGRRALDDGRLREAAIHLEQAIGLWREPALADVPDTPLLRSAASALLQRRQDAREWLIDARLSLGHHHELLGLIRAAVAADPFCEHQYVQLMLAEYRCGHKTAALAAYARLRTMTARELGLDPGPEAQEMLRRILADTEDLQFVPRLLARTPGPSPSA